MRLPTTEYQLVLGKKTVSSYCTYHGVFKSLLTVFVWSGAVVNPSFVLVEDPSMGSIAAEVEAPSSGISTSISKLRFQWQIKATLADIHLILYKVYFTIKILCNKSHCPEESIRPMNQTWRNYFWSTTFLSNVSNSRRMWMWVVARGTTYYTLCYEFWTCKLYCLKGRER